MPRHKWQGKGSFESRFIQKLKLLASGSGKHSNPHSAIQY